jgi:orotidine-5'-phosphate decarboxylase
MAPHRSHLSRVPNGQTELIVALDYARADSALQLVKQLAGLPVIFKVGSELFLHAGPALVRELVHQKCRVFLDLKFHDIPNTVVSAARQAATLQVELFTLHLSGGSAMVRAVREELDQIPELRPKLIGVSVLTSFDDVRWAEVTRAMTSHAVTAAESVLGLVESGSSWGIDGLVCSALELESVRRIAPTLYTVIPGIRPTLGAPVRGDDQSRIMSPRDAALAGASSIVMGRPITQASDPRKVVEQVLAELQVER